MAQSVFPVPSSASATILNYANSYSNTTNWTAPNTTNAVKVLCVAGGGGGGGIGSGGGAGSSVNLYAGPGAGGQVKDTVVSVTPGTTYTVTVGAGGNAGYVSATNNNAGGNSFIAGGAGGDSSFGSLVYSYGGAGGGSASMNKGNSGATSRYGYTYDGSYNSYNGTASPTGGMSSGYYPPQIVGNISEFGTTTFTSWSTANAAIDNTSTVTTGNLRGTLSGFPLLINTGNTYAQGQHKHFLAGGYGTAGYGAGAWSYDSLGNSFSVPNLNGLPYQPTTLFGPGSGGVATAYLAGNPGSSNWNGFAGQAGYVRLEYTA
jgi:hypothetical protein